MTKTLLFKGRVLGLGIRQGFQTLYPPNSVFIGPAPAPAIAVGAPEPLVIVPPDAVFIGPRSEPAIAVGPSEPLVIVPPDAVFKPR